MNGSIYGQAACDLKVSANVELIHEDGLNVAA
jgi:hypothetical protein